jgi:hypothetical protein
MESLRDCVPVGASVGIDTFTWYRLTNPGARPLKMILPVLPPMVTVGAALVPTSWVDEAGSPDVCGEPTGPSPLA